MEDRLIRVLHDGSFVDDPTRIMRAIRYEQRLGFQIKPSTLTLLSRDLHLLPSVGVDRLRRELDLFLLETAPELPLLRAESLGVLQTIDPALQLGARLSEIFQSARRQLGRSSLLYISHCSFTHSKLVRPCNSLSDTAFRRSRLVL